MASIDAIQSWFEDLEPPAYPFAIDQDAATRGARIFQERCNNCHGATGQRTWDVVALEEIGTDPNRVEAVSQEAIDEINEMWGFGWFFDEFRKTNGCANSLLDGIWLRAPYLHNGSVLTLRDLSSPPASRPRTFHRGNDVYDQENVGFVSTTASESNMPFSYFDTTREGNGNGGHTYGTDLSPSDRDALLEYLKTL